MQPESRPTLGPAQLAAEQDGVRFGASQSLRVVLANCLDDDMVAAAVARRPPGSKGSQAPVVSVVAAIRRGLRMRVSDVVSIVALEKSSQTLVVSILAAGG